MDYFFSEILQDLQQHICANVPEIAFIDQDLGQLAQVGENGRPPLAFPAVLIDFPDSTFSELATSVVNCFGYAGCLRCTCTYFKIVYLRDTTQHVRSATTPKTSCELLSKLFIFVTRHN